MSSDMRTYNYITSLMFKTMQIPFSISIPDSMCYYLESMINCQSSLKSIERDISSIIDTYHIYT